MTFKLDPSIFRDYDIRGIYPKEVNEKTYYLIGRAVAVYFKSGEIAVGRDTRLSSPDLFKSLVRGITDQGVNVIDLGLISTEMNYFASGKYGFGANIIVSASHNPPEYNGLKIVKKGVIPLHGTYGLPEIKEMAGKQNFPDYKKKGIITPKDITADWIKHVLSFIDVKSLKPLKVVIDAANGMGGLSWSLLTDLLPVKIIPLYFEPDGRFPNHLADPLDSKNMVDLQKKIKKIGADLGFAIDGDADRLFIVDDKSQLISGSLTTAMLAKHLLAKNGKRQVLYSVTCSKIVPETISNSGGLPVKTRVGHSFIKTEMRKLKGLFAGEHSGHFYFGDNYNADSSTIAGLLFLEFLSMQKLPLSKLRKQFEKYFSSGEINYYVDDSGKIIHNLISLFKDAKIDHTDGLTLYSKEWWFNLRLSKTEPLIRLNIEANSKEMLDNRLEYLEEKIISLGGKKKQ